MRVLFGTKAVNVAGTRVQLSTLQEKVLRIQFQGRAANTGRMFVGLVDVSATVNGWEIPIPVATKPTPPLLLDFAPGSVSLDVFYIDSTVNGEAVDWVAVLN